MPSFLLAGAPKVNGDFVEVPVVDPNSDCVVAVGSFAFVKDSDGLDESLVSLSVVAEDLIEKDDIPKGFPFAEPKVVLPLPNAGVAVVDPNEGVWVALLLAVRLIFAKIPPVGLVSSSLSDGFVSCVILLVEGAPRGVLVMGTTGFDEDAFVGFRTLPCGLVSSLALVGVSSSAVV